MPTPMNDEQTPEERRIRLQFRAEKKQMHTNKEDIPTIVNRLVQQWNRPYWEIERITKGHHIDTGDS